MTLTKADIIDSVAANNGYWKKESTDKVGEPLLEIIKRTLAHREDVLISGFGKFCANDGDFIFFYLSLP